MRTASAPTPGVFDAASRWSPPASRFKEAQAVEDRLLDIRVIHEHPVSLEPPLALHHLLGVGAHLTVVVR